MRLQSVFVNSIVGLLLLAATSFSQQPDAELARSDASKLDATKSDGSPSVAELSEKLQDNDPNVRWRAARALGNLGEEAKLAAPALVQLLNDPEPVVQIYATVALARTGDRSDSTIAGLAKSAQSTDPRVVRTAILALAKLRLEPEQLASAMNKLLASENQRMLVYVVDAIVDSGERATPLLQAALEENEDTAYWASVAIAEIGPPAAGTVPELAAVLDSAEDPDTIAQVLLALAKIGPEAKSAVPSIEKVLSNNPAPTIALYGAYGIGAIGSPGENSALDMLATSEDEAVSMVASWALAKTHSDDDAWRERAIEKMLEGLGSENPLVRTAAAKGLMDLKPSAESVTARLIEATQDADPEVAANVVTALASLGPAVVPGAAKSLDDQRLRPLLIKVLGRLGPDAQAAVPKLIELLPDADNELKAKIHYVLAGIGPAAAPAAQAIAESLNSTEPSVRHSALFALRQLGPGAADAMPQLMAMLESSDGMDQLAAAWALARIAPVKEGLSPEITQVLRKGLADDEPAARYETAVAIAQLGPSAENLWEELERIAKEDPDEQVRAAAEVALRKSAGQRNARR